MPEEKENYTNRPGVALGLPKTPQVGFPTISKGGLGDSKILSVNDYFTEKMNAAKPKGVQDIPLSSVYIGNRYDETRPGTDYEEMAAQQQSAWSKLGNGVGKMIGTAATSFGSGTLGLVYGALSVPFKGWPSLIDNDITRTLDKMSSTLEDVLPNYYTQTEKNAEWYSPDNILTANFFTDKIIKNLGFSIGALGGGVAWSKLFQAIGLTNKLVKAGVGLEAATAVENAMAAAPNLKKFTAFEGALNSTAARYLKDKAASALKQSDRILTSTMGTFGEASIEGLQSMNQFREKAIEEFREKYGYSPSEEEMERINEFANKIGMYTWGMNSILLTATNYIALPKILNSSKKSERAMINDVYQETVGDSFKKYTPKTYAGKLISGVRGVGRLLFAPSEAFEEGAQFAIQSGVNNYFQRGYDNGENVKSFFKDFNNSVGNVFGEGLEEAITTKEGLESILIGGLSGGMQQAGYFGSYKDEQGNTRFGFGKSGVLGEQGLFGLGGEKGRNTDVAVNALNKTNIKKVLKDGAKYLGAAMGSQQLRQDAVAANDTFSEKDYENDYLFSYIMPRVKYGKGKSIENELDMYEKQAMDDDGFRELQNEGIVNKEEKREQFLSRINKIKEAAKATEKIHSAISDKYRNRMDDTVIDKLTYAASKIRFYDERIPEINSGIVGIDTQPLVDELLKTGNITEGGKLSEETTKYIEDQIEKTSATEDDVKDKVGLVESLGEAVLRRKKYIDEYNDILKNPDKYKEDDRSLAPETEPETKPTGQVIKIKTKSGEIDVEVGEKYRMGRVIRYDKDNNPVYRAPEFVFLGENEDGTLRIKDGKGERNVSKDEFIEYNVGKSSTLEKNKKAKYFYEHWNVLYEHKGLKDQQGKPRKGRLEYNPKNDKMLFVYFDEKGRRREVEVINRQFVAQEGYTTPMLNPLGELTAVQQSARDEFTSSKEDISATLQDRKKLVAEVVTSSKKRVEEINKELDKASSSMEKIDEALKNAMFTKKGLPRKALKNYSKTIDELTKQKEALEKTVDALKDEKDELESQLPHLESLLEYAQSLPENYNDAITDMKEEVASLKEMVENTEQSIKSGESMIEKLNTVLTNALSLFNDFVRRLSEENPNLPLYIDVFKEKISKFLGEEGAENFVKERLGYTDAVRDLEDQLSEFREELDIPQSTSKLEKLQANVSELKEGLAKLKSELAAKEALLNKFEELVQQMKEQKAREELLKKSDEFINAVFGTMDTSQRTMEYDSNFEQDSKKDNVNVVRATIPSPKLPGYENANRFGNNYPNLKNKDKIRAIIVTSKNEEAEGLKGLTKHLAQKRDELPKDDPNYIDPTQTIVVVMVEEQPDGSRVLIGVDGQPVGDNPTFENTVYQVMPSEELKWSEEFGGKSMFRQDTDKTVKDSLTKQYTEWRNSILSNPPTRTYRIEASFGTPEPVMIKDDSGKDVPDDSARTSVTEAGLVTSDQIATKPLLYIPTTSKIIGIGTTKFKNALGRVFLMLSNAYVKLENRKITEKEAEVIYKVIERVSTRVYEDENAQADDVKRMLNWLKSVVYWGTPKDRNGNKKEAGYNSIWFERGTIDVDGKPVSQLVLYMSNKGAKIPFDPAYIRDNKTQIVEALTKMYNNVNSTYAVGSKKVNWNEPYEEIMDVNPDGTLVTRDWPSYQAFLLSDKVPDENGNLKGPRPKEEFPVYVKIRPKTSPEDTNRKNVYFVLSDVKYTEPKVEPAPAPKAQTKITKITAGQGAAGVKKGAPILRENPEGVVKVDGRSVNTYVAPKSDKPVSGMKVRWTWNPNKTGIDAIVVMPGADLQGVLEYLTKTQGSEDAAKQMLKRTLLASIPKEAFREDEDFVFDENGNVIYLDEQDTSSDPEEDVIDEEEVPTDSVSDIERRKKQSLSETEWSTGPARGLYLRQEPDGRWTSAYFKPSTTGVDAENIYGSTKEEVIAELEKRYNIELDALEGAKPADEKTNEPSEEDILFDDADDDVHDEDLRAIIEEEDKKFEPENWAKIESFLKENFPWLPVYRVKNIIKATNGLQAWGMLKDGAIYIYENAEVGTLYHEVFEAVWKHFSDAKEQRSIINEFRSRKGTFIDRPTGREIAYKDATRYQIKEQLAEEFRDYVQYKKIPPKPVDSRPFILKLFSDIVNFVKNFFANTPGAKNNTERLFQKIGTGYYKKYNPMQNKLSFAKQGILDIDDAIATENDELRLKLSGEVTHDVMQELTYLTLTKLVGNNEDLFETQAINKNTLYRDLKYNLGRAVLRRARVANKAFKDGKVSKEKRNSELSKGITLWRNIKSQWPSIIEKHEEYLRSYAIEFDENDEVNLRAEENTGRGEYDGADKIDHFRKMNSAIKLLLSTVPMMMDGKLIYSSIGGVKLLPLSKVYMTLMNNLHTSRNLDDMISRIRDLAMGDENYRRLYYRLTKRQYTDDTFSLDSIESLPEAKLLIAMWTTFKKQNPDVKTVFIFESGEVNIGDSSLSTAARQVKSQYESAMKVAVRKPKNKYFEYSEKERAYIGKKGSVIKDDLDKTSDKVRFLKDLGINFTEDEINKLPSDKKRTFDDAVSGIRTSIREADKITTVGGKSLEIEGRLMNLALIRATIDNPEFDSTFFNVKGERTQSYIGTNVISELFDAIHQIDDLSELRGTQYEYILTDSFAKNSVIINRMFNVVKDEDGNIVSGERIENIPNYLKGAYADGTVNNQTGKSKPSSKQTYKDRLIQEINMNLNGYYANLVPGDASIEHMVFMGNAITDRTLLSGFNRVFKIFEGYFVSEVALSREKDREIVQDANETRDKKDLRFFKGILGEELHNKIINDKRKLSPQQLYNAYKPQIDSAVENFIKREAERTKALLESYEIVRTEENKVVTQGLGLPLDMTEAEYSRQMNTIAVNYIVNNIELHKLIYSDPYKYSDELKRIKNFLSPRQAILHGSAAMNAALNKVWNTGYSKGDIGYTDMTKDYFNTIVGGEIFGEHDLEGYVGAAYKEADGAGIMTDRTNRNFRIRVGNWNPSEEAQYRYDIAWYKSHKGLPLSPEEEKLLNEYMEIDPKKNPHVRSAYTTQKPIVSGNNESTTNNPILDKFALYPLSYRVAYEMAPRDADGNVIETNAMRLYDKMMAENIDYLTLPSGRKVGAKNTFELYDENGVLNSQSFPEATQVPFSIISVQAEMPSKEDEMTTRGTQMTKLVTMDFMEAGVPIDFLDKNGSAEFSTERYEEWYNIKTEEEKETRSPLYKEIKNNQLILEQMIENGYQSLLKRFGITETVGKDGRKSFDIADMSVVVKTLKEEILKRESNDNIIESLDGLIKGDVVIEGSPAYRQIRNILYSIADKQVISPKLTGGQKIQIPSALLETNRITPKIIKGKKVYTSEVLDFYIDEDGKRVCQVMVGRWFDSPLSDEELMDYFNNTEEGRQQLSALSGVGYRIPTQKQNSIDRFVIKKFLPREFGDNVVVPAALVQKAGSDFDIDKLSLYFKNLFTGKDGKPKLIRFLTNANSKVEDRYVNWVRENADRDTRRYVKFLTRSVVESLRNDFKAELDSIKSEIKATAKEMAAMSYQKMQDEILAEKNEKLSVQDSYMKELFEEGGKLFWSLNENIIDEFLNLKEEIRKKQIKGPEEIRLYLDLAQGMLTTRKNLNLGDKTKLTLMVKLYKQELKVLGASEEIVNDIVKSAIERFRKEKDVDYKSVIEASSDEFAKLRETYDQTFTEQEVEAAKEIAQIDGLASIDEFGQMSIYKQNVKLALENAYVESLENLISHESNFRQLVKPNSADTLKDLAKDIVGKKGLESFDYSSTVNMLNRSFMSRLRHAFVSGKYAIGIAAVNQTNHSLNQRQLIYLDSDAKNIPDEDKEWLGDGKIKFKQYNKMKIGSKTVPVLSMIKNAAGEYISDIIGMFIDGYVDIAKGPWIMELGAHPNVASTYLFLLKLGVPSKSVVYFMNQPIIQQYLKKIETSGYSWLFIDDLYDSTLKEYGDPDTKNVYNIPSETSLGDMIGKKPENLNKQQKEQQAFMLGEFVKYAKMASHMFAVTQGSNFDTANFNDPYLVFKKMEQFEKAKQTMIRSVGGSAVEGLVNNSFLRKLSGTILDIRDAYAEILRSDRTNVRSVIEPILRNFIDMSDREFVKIAQKVVTDLFDWAVQTDREFNKYIKVLVGDNSTPEKVMDFVNSVKNDKSHALHKNFVINSLTLTTDNDVNNLMLTNRDNKVYDQNQIIYAFSEIKDHLKGTVDEDIYKRIVLTSVLQSGLSSSKISFTSLLPYEDFKEIYNQSLAKLNQLPNLHAYRDLGVFFRNNWNNDDVVAQSSARLVTYTTKYGITETVYNPAMEWLPGTLKTAMNEGKIPQVVAFSALGEEGRSEFVSYSWERPMSDFLTEEEMNSKDRYKIWKAKKLEMRKRGNYSYLNKGLFRKVYVGTQPLSYTYESKGKVKTNYVYMMVNAWGDSFRANEFYDVAKPSVLDNKFLKVQEVDGSLVVEALRKDKKASTNKPQKGTMKLKDGVTYAFPAINAKMLEAMGYNSKEIGKILKSIC